MSRVLVNLVCASALLSAMAMPIRAEVHPRHACDLLSAQEFAAITDRKAMAGARQIRGTNDQSQPGGAVTAEGTDCGFTGSSLTTELQRLASLERFSAAVARRVQAGELQPVQGIGDAAWFRHNKATAQHGFVGRVGTTMFVVMINTSEAGSAEKARAMLLPVAKTIAAKLR